LDVPESMMQPSTDLTILSMNGLWPTLYSSSTAREGS
jgi:hypothetical protein